MAQDDEYAVRTFLDRTALAVVVVAALALIARFVFLGERVAHWDEGRVGYDILRYVATGGWEYRPQVHGPFLPQVNRYVFELFGATDFTSRFAVAVVGGLFPLAALLFRERLRDSEVVALALLFAANPLLLYYSRFMRNDVLLAAFMIAALGFFVRTLDTRKPRYLYAATAFLALGFTTKENVLVYLVAWIGAGVLLVDHRLFRVSARRENSVDHLLDRIRATGRSLWQWRWAFLIAFVEFFVIIVYFFAPRPDLQHALTDPALLPGVAKEATVGSWQSFYATWVPSPGEEGNVYKEYFSHFVKTMLYGAAPLAVFSVVGFLADRYEDGGPRDVVSLAFYWGFATVFVYPIITDIQAPWGPVHAVAPLAIPAAVGLALVYRWGRSAFSEGDAIGGTVAAALLLTVAMVAGVTVVDTSYLNPQSQENELVQYGQPADGIRPTIEAIEPAIADNDGTDVLFFGETFYVGNESSADRLPAGGNWYNRLPLPWYLEQYGAETNSTTNVDQFRRTISEERPPVVIVRRMDRGQIEPHLQGYRAYEHDLTLWVPSDGEKTVFFFDESRLSEADRPEPND